ncbi:MAG TPA: hypothetical protein VKE24_01905, partial [Candidatus Acidoferrales bacterium]|nr:hypothetical protein [Candidatus Acidoferrales bacterium]
MAAEAGFPAAEATFRLAAGGMVGGMLVCVASGVFFSTTGGRSGPSSRARILGADGVAGRSVLVSGEEACLAGDGAGSRGGVSTAACGAGGLVVSAA